MSAVVQAFFDPTTFTVTYVLSDKATGKAAIIDSVLDYEAASGRTATTSADRVVEYVEGQKLDIEYILETHVHADHVSAAPYLQSKLCGQIAIGNNVGVVQGVFGELFNAGAGFARDGSQFDLLLDDGETLALGDTTISVMHTPGHTPACVTYVADGCAFVGDTLFMPDYGTARCDFPGGDAATLYRSIRKILSLPDETTLYMCHDYGGDDRDYEWVTSVGQQKADNVHIGGDTSEAEFVEMRESRDATLSMPALILPSVQVNMRAGHFPPADANGIVYLKIPVDRV